MVDDDGLAGIFTEKDLLNRVLAKGRSPDTVVVADVMTPNPDTVSSNMTVLEALQEVRRLGLLGRFLGKEAACLGGWKVEGLWLLGSRETIALVC